MKQLKSSNFCEVIYRMSWISILCIFFISGTLGTPPGGTNENFYNYRMDYDDDLEYSNGYQSELKRMRGGAAGDYYDDMDDGYRKTSDDWSSRSRGWGPSTSFNFNRIPTRHYPEKMACSGCGGNSGGWTEEEETPASWSPPPRRRKPSYVVKIRRPVKKDPAWIYFRPPNPGRVAPGWSRPRPETPQPPPIRRPPVTKVVNSWEDESHSGYPKDASYSFAYDAGDSERSEYADPWGTVRGSYSYIDPTGIRRTVHYTAGASTGFKILNSSPSNMIESVYRDPVVVRRKPSAFVYHLHPDGGWKPWEGRKEVSSKGRPRMGGDEQVDEELTLDETRYDHHGSSSSRKMDDSQMHHRRYESPLEQENRKVEVRGYEGGYGDKNPLLVMEDKKISAGKMMAMRMRRRKPDQHMSESSSKSSSSHRKSSSSSNHREK